MYEYEYVCMDGRDSICDKTKEFQEFLTIYIEISQRLQHRQQHCTKKPFSKNKITIYGQRRIYYQFSILNVHNIYILNFYIFCKVKFYSTI